MGLRGEPSYQLGVLPWDLYQHRIVRQTCTGNNCIKGANRFRSWRFLEGICVKAGSRVNNAQGTKAECEGASYNLREVN